MEAAERSIWIDLDNSPHVPLFVPIIRRYRESGVNVILTARDHSQTIELLHLADIAAGTAIVGRHYGKSKINKVRGLLVRAMQLFTYIKGLQKGGANIAVAVSHGSRSMVLAAKWLGIPALTMYDYEFTETSLFNRFSAKVMVPEQIPDRVLDEIGLPEEKRIKYPGIKEELYVREFEPCVTFRSKVLKDLRGPRTNETVLVTLRPPATTANYHSEQSETVLKAILKRLLFSTGVFTVIVPRTAEQAKEIGELADEMGAPDRRFAILGSAVDGLQLAYASDLLISGGGTMNREAALLGIPVYSIFAGRQGSLDAAMETSGLIKFVRNEKDVAEITLDRRTRDAAGSTLTDRVERSVIGQIDAFLRSDR